MRSRNEYLLTKDEVHGVASLWLGDGLKLKHEGRTCSASTIIQVLLIAAARVVSVYAACCDLADAPCDQTIRDVLEGGLPEVPELERRLNRALTNEFPKALRRKSRVIAIDLTLIPYHGQPHKSAQEIYRSTAKSGTTHFHAYATSIVIHKGHRYTLAMTRVERRESMKNIVQRLLKTVRQQGVKVRYLLLDKGFFSVEVFSYLKRAGYGFIVPAVARGRKPQPGHSFGLKEMEWPLSREQPPR